MARINQMDKNLQNKFHLMAEDLIAASRKMLFGLDIDANLRQLENESLDMIAVIRQYRDRKHNIIARVGQKA